jgi:hypothetical protein
MHVELERKREGYFATPSPFMVVKGHFEAPPSVALQKGMVTKRNGTNWIAGSIFPVPDLQLERGTSSHVEYKPSRIVRNSHLYRKILKERNMAAATSTAQVRELCACSTATADLREAHEFSFQSKGTGFMPQRRYLISEVRPFFFICKIFFEGNAAETLKHPRIILNLYRTSSVPHYYA